MNVGGLRRDLAGAGIEDILLAGLVDLDEEPTRFHPLYRLVYFELGEVFLKFSVLDYTGRMRIEKAKAPTVDQERDGGLAPAYARVGEMLLDDAEGQNRIATVHLWGGRDAVDGTGIDCAAARFDLTNGQQLFVDPSYHFGIRIGGAERQRIWTENWPGNEDYVEVRISDS